MADESVPEAPPEQMLTAAPELRKPPLLFSKTQPIINKIAEHVQGTVITYWHSPGGSVCQNDVMGLYEILEGVGKRETTYLFIKSAGGDGMASLRIVNLLRRYTDRLITLLPLECASAATMIALGSDEIRMGPLAYLTAVDTSIVHELSPTNDVNRRVRVGLDELRRFVQLWRTYSDTSEEDDGNPYGALLQHVHPLVIGAVDRSSSLSVKLCTEILDFHLDDRAKAAKIAESLNADYPAHSFPILEREAKRIGLNACSLDPTLNMLLLDLNELYSEMGQQAITDFDADNYHNNEILNIIESTNVQVYYQNDKDFHFSNSERRWIAMNDNSSWRKIERVGKRTKRSVFHIR
ncbi:MAG: hypothetical protein KC561_01060 [Myxococcales bacterium]|nr:hypothetical protein [Myxococcales bacterium]